MQEPSIFTRIINGEVPAHIIYQDERVIAFLDTHPISEGHTLVVPKKQVDQIWDLDKNDYEYLWEVVRKIGSHTREIIKSTRVGVIVEGFGVPHAHIHIIPIYHSNDLKKFQDHSIEPDHEALAQIALKLKM
jgi:histidine triad (HIT) family protein